jgi:hypothetical protein
MPILGRVLQCVVQGTVTSTSGSTRKVYNDFVYRSVNGTDDAAELLAFAGIFNLTVMHAITFHLHTSYVANSFKLSFPQLPAVAPVIFPTVEAGRVMGGRLPLVSAAYVGLATGLRGKSFLGSKRFAPIPLNQVSGDEYTPASHAAALARFQLIGQQILAPPYLWVPVVWSRQLTTFVGGVPTTCVGADITAVTLNYTLGQWRHRRERMVR